MGIGATFEGLPKWLIALVSSAAPTIGAVVIWFWTDFNKFRDQQVQEKQIVIAQALDADAALDPYLVKYKDLILGKAIATEKDFDGFSEALRLSHQRAFDLKSRYSTLNGPFNEYSGTLVGLRQSINNLDGPADGKKYLLALSRYLIAQSKWKESVYQAKSSYAQLFSFR